MAEHGHRQAGDFGPKRMQALELIRRLRNYERGIELEANIVHPDARHRE